MTGKSGEEHFFNLQSLMVKRPFRYYYLRVMRQTGTPDMIAGGMALGLFCALVVPPGLQIAVAILLAFIFKLNRIASLAGCLITNPLTWPPILYLQVRCGSLITGDNPPVRGDFDSMWDYMRAIGHDGALIRSYLLGSVISGIMAALIGYFLTRFLVEQFRRRKAKRDAIRQARMARQAEDSPPPL